MEKQRTIRIVDKKPEHWDAVVLHPLQSWEWGEFRKKMGIDVVRVGVFDSDTLVSAWQVTFHSVPKLPFTIGYFPKGPEPTQEMLDQLTILGKKKHAIYIQLEPNLQGNPISNFQTILPSHHPLFTKYTFILDLTQSEENLLKAMHPKSRYNIKVAQKHEVIIQEDSSDAAFQAYLALEEETTKRQGFYAHSPIYHKRMWETLSKSGIAKLFIASFKGQVLAAWIIFAFGDTIYYPYGASSRDHRETQAPTLLLWEIAKWGKKNGYKQFDLWGAMEKNPDESDPWFGFHQFKERFAPKHVEFVGSYDLVLSPILYKLYVIADSIRWFVLKKIR